MPFVQQKFRNIFTGSLLKRTVQDSFSAKENNCIIKWPSFRSTKHKALSKQNIIKVDELLYDHYYY